ncbi:hypothetical protein JVT61DRAFT_7378 [Boletus reticuloceps]|uniref:Uncharacterized protein n=1 Tax=Boletus reticuloceps TaxID=495285 RepID=A0A8I2YIR7_9AGAM|nr:hypothetical protein JVT61DRAFT_7378 [Boletus reticuloceps]
MATVTQTHQFDHLLHHYAISRHLRRTSRAILSPFHLSFIPSQSNSAAPDFIVQAENLLQAALNDLESRGVLQHSNRMNISELLNPVAESRTRISTMQSWRQKGRL